MFATSPSSNSGKLIFKTLRGLPDNTWKSVSASSCPLNAVLNVANAVSAEEMPCAA